MVETSSGRTRLVTTRATGKFQDNGSGDGPVCTCFLAITCVMHDWGVDQGRHVDMLAADQIWACHLNLDWLTQACDVASRQRR